MKLLERFSTIYVAEEDRLRLSSEIIDGTLETIWLTQRFLLGALPPLLKWLEKQIPSSLSINEVQEFQQQASTAAIKPQKPVQAEADHPSWIPTTANIASSEKMIKITLKDCNQNQVHLNLTAKQLRQWLSIVHDCWGKAGWPPQVWPDWIGSSGNFKQGLAAMLH